jgi:hypothetical protein
VNGPPIDHDRANRELIELLGELRIILPGVQVLFAFLLTVPLSGRFEALNHYEKALYLFAFFASAIAAVLLIAPTPYHRIRFRRGDKEALLRASNRLALIGLAFLAVSICAVVGLVTAIIANDAVSLIAIAIAALFVLSLWFGIPVSRAYRHRDRPPSGL